MWPSGESSQTVTISQSFPISVHWVTVLRLRLMSKSSSVIVGRLSREESQPGITSFSSHAGPSGKSTERYTFPAAGTTLPSPNLKSELLRVQ